MTPLARVLKVVAFARADGQMVTGIRMTTDFAMEVESALMANMGPDVVAAIVTVPGNWDPRMRLHGIPVEVSSDRPVDDFEVFTPFKTYMGHIAEDLP